MYKVFFCKSNIIYCTYVNTYTHIHIYTYTYIHTDILTYIHTYIQTYTHTHIHTYIHTHTYIIHTHTHIHAYTHIHIYVHTYIHIYIVVCERATLFVALLSLLYPPAGTITDLPSGNHTWLENLHRWLFSIVLAVIPSYSIPTSLPSNGKNP